MVLYERRKDKDSHHIFCIAIHQELFKLLFETKKQIMQIIGASQTFHTDKPAYPGTYYQAGASSGFLPEEFRIKAVCVCEWNRYLKLMWNAQYFVPNYPCWYCAIPPLFLENPPLF